jgi:hypothetical protein
MTRVNCTVYIASNVSYLLMMNWKGWGRNHSWPAVRYNPNISLQRVRITTKIPSQVSRSPYRASNPGLPGYESRVWTTGPGRSFLRDETTRDYWCVQRTMVLDWVSDKYSVRGQTGSNGTRQAQTQSWTQQWTAAARNPLYHSQSATVSFATKVLASWSSKCWLP